MGGQVPAAPPLPGADQELEQWQDRLLALVLDSVQVVASEAWTLDLVTALVDQLPLYNSISKEKSFAETTCS